MARPAKRNRKRTGPGDQTAAPANPGPGADYTERLAAHTETSPRQSGGDVDADWERAATSGEEAVGGSVATPDQDVVDELGRAVGVEQAPTAPLQASEEILRDRDARYWDLEWRAERRERDR